ncbi:S46 family peptidase [Shewanella zhangzhouensis]|uniref:S46 family peptidase n=1 Tax=Shewanella zhangzhouensis TaxID=2864213 RepID=UPI001C65BF92|nr:S46 family peptidase [Shewanella zhangzhouensis]QYK04686.1 S46 family peptidase [Shewanella zhangzhouensis]
MRNLVAAALVLSSGVALADEGQWQPYQMPSIADKLKARGIDIPAEQLADLSRYPMNAVVGLGYCTASFVSPQGLAVTNHHCAFRAIQYNSSKEKNYLADGFLATSMDKEPSAGPNERLYVTEAVTDVSAQIRDALPEEPLARVETIENRQKALIKECESDDNYRCSVRSFHNGLEYYLIKQLMIRDVRLVYAPPESVGGYGGDIDNYEYPRHSGDFTFLRAYVGKDGKPAPYAEDNVPYQPKSFLKINASGVKAGDGVFAAGYPGSTSRYRLTTELEFASDWLYPTQAKRFQARIDTIEAMGAADAELAIKYAGTVAGMANRMKKLNGLLDGFKATDIAAIKQQREDAFMTWYASHGDAKQMDELKALIKEGQTQYQTTYYFNNAQSSDLLTAANSLYRLAKEKQKADADRELGYQERDMKMFADRLKRIDSSFDVKVDRVLWQADIEEYLGQDQRVDVLDKMLTAKDGQDLSSMLDGLYATTGLTDQATRLGWMDKTPADFEASNDPFIKLAVALYDTRMAQEKAEKTLDGKLSIARPAMMQAVIAYNKDKGWPVYPDANGTLRITYGMVDGYQSRDALYKQPFTRLEGIVAKHTGVEPFNAPQKVLDAIKRGDMGTHKVDDLYPDARSFMCKLFSCQDKPEAFNSVPVNFLSSVDTTGGNSGSPVFNGRGELVGLNFDSTYEAITKDWFFNPEITRAVHVDIRYILWMMDKVDNAQNLLQELTLVTN